MIAKVQKKSPYGLMLEGDSDWKNLSKFQPVDLTFINSGDTVEIELAKNKYIKSIRKIEQTETAQETIARLNAPSQSQPANNGTKPRPIGDNDLRIVRESAIKSVLSSSLTEELVKAKTPQTFKSGVQDLIKEMVSYILTGEFETAKDEEMV